MKSILLLTIAVAILASAYAGCVADKAKEAYESTKEVGVDGYEKTKDLSKKTGTFVKDQFTDKYKSSEEDDHDKKVPLAGASIISSDVDIRGSNDDSQSKTKRR